MIDADVRRQQIAELTRLTTKMLIPVGAIVVVILALAKYRDIPVTDLLRDPAATLDGQWYVGLFSSAGVALWAASAAMCLVALAATPGTQLKRLLIAGAVISLMLGADDGLLLHETIKNEVGIPSPITIAVYAIVAVVLLGPLITFIARRPDFLVLLAAVAGFAISIILDFGGEAGLPTPPLSEVMEDIAKFLGIATWTYYFGGVAIDAIRHSSEESS